jgi:hypothetical protein
VAQRDGDVDGYRLPLLQRRQLRSQRQTNRCKRS